jgi:DNA-binding response OmpR family regulator
MSLPGERILLIDDDPILLRVSAEVLHRAGHEIVTATTGHEGLQLLAHQPFAAAIVDIVLPDGSGLDVLKAIKEASPDVVVLLVTGSASLETAIEALRCGAFDYLRKPFANDDLTQIVARGLEQRRLQLTSRRLLTELNAINRDLMERVSLATDELAAFAALGHDFEEAGTPARMLELVVQAAARLTGAADCALFHRQADGRVVCLQACGERAEELRRLELPGEHLVREALATERPAIHPHLLRDPATATGPLALAGFTSALVVPLLSLSGTAGVLLLLDGAKPFTERQASLVKAMAAHAAEIIPAVSAPPPPPEAPDDFVDLHDLLGRES